MSATGWSSCTPARWSRTARPTRCSNARATLYDGSHQCLPGPRSGRRGPRLDRGQPARPPRPAEGLPLLAALPVRPAAVQRRRARPRGGRRPPRRLPSQPRGAGLARARLGDRDVAILVEARDLTKHYPARRSIAEALAGKHPVVRAVDGIGFTIGEGESVGLLGESGCGKTTTGRLLLKLVKPSAGAILFEGEPLGALAGPRLRAFRRKAQLVFQ